jgi:hypothetical protein
MVIVKKVGCKELINPGPNPNPNPNPNPHQDLFISGFADHEIEKFRYQYNELGRNLVTNIMITIFFREIRYQDNDHEGCPRNVVIIS